MESKRYPLLNDGEWVAARYREGASTSEISEEVGGCSRSLVRRVLIEGGVPLRGRREARIHKRVDDGFILRESVVCGCLLGDASLQISSRVSDGVSPCFLKRNKDRGHIEYVASLLFGEGWESRVSDRTRYREDRDVVYELYELSSLTHDELMPLFKEWYPEASGYRKVVPPNIEMDEEVLLHWFLDDGDSIVRPKTKSKQVIVRFATMGFTREEQIMLCDKINSRYDLSANFTTSSSSGGSGYYMYIPQTKVGRFFQIIGPPPFDSLSYKWK